MLTVVSIAFWSYFVLSLPLLFVGALLVRIVSAPFDRRRVALHLYSCAWAAHYLVVNPIWRLRVTGRERLPWRGPAVIVANHSSLVDILVLFALFRPFKWVSKQSVFALPFLGWNMRLNGYVPIKRGERESIIAMTDACRNHLAQGSPVLLFPEGTRSPTTALLPFKDGAFRLAAEAACPLVPIAVHATGQSLPKHGLILRNGMDAWLEVLEPIATAGRTADELRDAARLAIEQALVNAREASASGKLAPA